MPHIIYKHLGQKSRKAYSRERYAAFDAVQRNTILAKSVNGSQVNLLDLHAVSAACGSELHCITDGIHRRSKVYMATVQIFLNLVKAQVDSGLLPLARQDCNFCE
jgi:hypothetical protein